MTLVTLENAKRHLRLSESTHEDDDIRMKIVQAQAIVLDYVTQRLGDAGTAWSDTVAAWDDESVPPMVQAAILLQLNDLYRHRGDDPMNDEPRRHPSGLLLQVAGLLGRLRDPAIA